MKAIILKLLTPVGLIVLGGLQWYDHSLAPMVIFVIAIRVAVHELKSYH